MCGIAGLIDSSPRSSSQGLRDSVGRMIATLANRGPDAGGTWVDDSKRVALGHRRLSILDLSAAGAQPMTSRSKRLVITFNGEIYNYDELKKELPLGTELRGHSDTEVMLELMAAIGVGAATRRLNGMFAFAVWDAAEQVLHLARDRMGEKPLYYGWLEGVFLFGSELRALRAFPGFRASVDRKALALYMHHGYVPGPRSIFANIHKLPPGSMLTVSTRAPGSSPVTRYWSARQAFEQGVADPLKQDMETTTEQLDHLLRDAVRIRMQADVPLGAFLSGGVDSSAIVALMQAQSTRPTKTFTIGFESKEHDESEYARAVARHLGTEHTELLVTGRDALAVVPLLPQMYDEPFADSSQIPTHLVSKLARQHVIVSLSGDGGDELFGGYTRYAWGKKIWDRIHWLPRTLRIAAGRILGSIPQAAIDAADKTTAGRISKALSIKNLGHKVKKLGSLLEADTFDSLYLQLVSQWSESPVLGTLRTARTWDLAEKSQATPDPHDQMMLLDMITYLPDDILTKVDRASMAVSLESRAPLLDHRIVEFAWRLPSDQKIHNGVTKAPLRGVLDRYVPKKLIDRPKMGFGVPIGAWLRGPLQGWAQDLLTEDALRRDGFLDPQPIRIRLEQHLAGTANHDSELWTVLMFQAWLHH